MDETSAKSKLENGRIHEATMDYALENFDLSIKKYKAMLDKD